MDEDEILKALNEGEAEQPRLQAVVTATEYEVRLSQADADALDELGHEAWHKLENSLYRRGVYHVCIGEDGDAYHLCFTLRTKGNLDYILDSIQEEIDELTGRKMEQAGAELWGMF
jgi:hypothetical protein